MGNTKAVSNDLRSGRPASKAEPVANKRRKLAFRIIVIACAVLATNAAMNRVLRVDSHSVPFHWAWIVGGGVQKGDYAFFMQAHPIIDPTGAPARLTKRVVCVAGQRIHLEGDTYFCDDEALGGFITKTEDGRELTPIAFDEVIPEGKVFAMGVHPRSFDSRYFGLVDLASMTRVRGLL